MSRLSTRPTQEERSAAAGSVLVGLVGKGIQLSRTPFMHEVEGRAQAIPYVYRLLDTDCMGDAEPELGEVLRLAASFGFTGLNVTFPYKQAILPLLDELSPAARAVGSVNTVVFRNGRRLGHNTDVWGFRESFRRGMAGAPLDTVLLVGAGGAGGAVAHALLDLGVGCLLLHDLDAGRAHALAASLAAHFGAGRAQVDGDLERAAGRACGIVNATPVGMAKLPGTPVPAALLRAAHWVADIIYFPLETELLRQARAAGCRTFPGEGMAVWQAVRAFELFTGIVADANRMRAAFADFDRAAASRR